MLRQLNQAPFLWVPAERSAQAMAAHALLRPFEVLQHAQRLSSIPGRAASVVAGAARAARRLGLLRYEADPRAVDDAGTEYDPWRSPRQTRRERKGDCEDLSLYWASVLDWLCPAVDFVVGPGHAWVEGWDEGGWFLLEATSGTLYRYARPASYGYEYLRVRTPGMHALVERAA